MPWGMWISVIEPDSTNMFPLSERGWRLWSDAVMVSELNFLQGIRFFYSVVCLVTYDVSRASYINICASMYLFTVAFLFVC